MDLGNEPTAPIPLPNLPPPPPSVAPTMSTAPASGAAPAPPGRPPARWTSAAKATAIVLALTTVAGVGFGVAQFTRANDKGDRVDELEQELVDVNDDLDAAETDLDNASGTATDLQTQLDTANGQLADVTARRDALASLFPLAVATINQNAPAGQWGLVNVPGDCSGFSDPTASCVPDNFPSDIVVEGSADAGYTVSSAWYPAIALTFDGSSRWTGSGELSPDFSNTCGGAPNATTVSIDFAVTGVAGDEATATLVTTQLSGSVTLASGETATCVGATRAATWVTAAG